MTIANFGSQVLLQRKAIELFVGQIHRPPTSRNASDLGVLLLPRGTDLLGSVDVRVDHFRRCWLFGSVYTNGAAIPFICK
jgi:hypothetical protein